MLTLGARIKAYRLGRGWTQKYLSEISTVHQPLISQLESGQKQWTSVEVVAKLAGAFGVTIDRLMYGETYEGTKPAGEAMVGAEDLTGSTNALGDTKAQEEV